ncbi:MAG: methyltransferase domain-containing protein [Candidatus Magasanikbacteria bacterium]
MKNNKPGTIWGKKHYNIRNVSKYHLEPAPFIRDAVRFLKENGVKTILDAGCGQGRNSLYLKKQNFDVISVDASKEACKLTKQLFKKNNFNFFPINSELQSMPKIQSNSADAIICVTVLTHIFDPEIVLKEFYRILKPGGFLVADLANNKDSTFPIISKTGTPLGKNVFLEKGTNVKYFEDVEDVKTLFHRFKILSSQDITFEEPPHPGSRPYKHKHSSFVITAKK